MCSARLVPSLRGWGGAVARGAWEVSSRVCVSVGVFARLLTRLRLLPHPRPATVPPRPPPPLQPLAQHAAQTATLLALPAQPLAQAAAQTATLPAAHWGQESAAPPPTEAQQKAPSSHERLDAVIARLEAAALRFESALERLGQ